MRRHKTGGAARRAEYLQNMGKTEPAAAAPSSRPLPPSSLPAPGAPAAHAGLPSVQAPSPSPSPSTGDAALDELLAWVRAVEEAPSPAAVALPEPLAVLAEDTGITRVTVEVIRTQGGRLKRRIGLRSKRRPALDRDSLGAAGWDLRGAGDTLGLRRESAEILILGSGRRVEIDWSESHTPADAGEPAEATRFLGALAHVRTLAPFVALAQPGAVLRSFGVARDASLGLLALVALNRDLDRVPADEAAMHAAGFAAPDPGDADADDDDAPIWSTAGSASSVAWVGGTVYGYVGPVPRRALGGWV